MTMNEISTLDAWKFFLKGRIAQEQENFEEAVEAFEQTLRCDPHHPFAPVTRACSLARLGHIDAAVTAFDEIAENFSDASDIRLRERGAAALCNKAFHLSKLGRYMEAVTAYEEVVSHFENAPEKILQERVALAKRGRSSILNVMRKS